MEARGGGRLARAQYREGKYGQEERLWDEGGGGRGGGRRCGRGGGLGAAGGHIVSSLEGAFARACFLLLCRRCEAGEFGKIAQVKVKHGSIF